MKAIVKIKAVFAFLLMATISISAQDISITLTVDKDTVNQGEFIRVLYQIENASADMEQLDFPGLDIVSGPNNSFSMQVINGEMTQSKSYEIIGRAIEPGLLRIPAGKIEVDGVTYMSEEMTVFVRENSSYDPNARPRSYQAPSFRTPRQPATPTPPSKPRKKMKTIRI